MADKQTFRVATTPRARFTLARLFCRGDLKFKDRTKEKRLYRARKSLGLIEPSEYILAGKPPSDRWKDRSVAAFEVTVETAEFVVETFASIEKDSGEAFMLEELVEQLEAKVDAPEAFDVEMLDIAAEAPLWKPQALIPILDRPEAWFDTQREIMQACTSYGAYRKAMLEVLLTPQQRTELLAAEAAEAPATASDAPAS